MAVSQARMEMLQVGALLIDPAYQRAVDPRWVKKLAASWDESKAGAIVVSQRPDGKRYVIDGFHRVQALRLAQGDDAVIPAVVYDDLSPQQEAERFDTLQRMRKSLTTFEVFHARLAYNEPAAVEIQNIVHSLGLTIGRSGGESVVAAISALDNVYAARGGAAMLYRVLTLLRDGLDGNRKFAWQPVKGMRTFLRKFPQAEDAIIVSALQRRGTDGMAKRQFEFATPASSSAGSAETGWAKAMHREYNQKRTSHRLPDWD